MSRTFRESLHEQMNDPAFKQEWEAQESEFQVIKAIIKARKEQNMTQKQLADRTGIDQADISKIENGNANPSLKTLQRLASGMGMKMRVEFIPFRKHEVGLQVKS